MDPNRTSNTTDDVLVRAMRRLRQRAGAALGGATLLGAAAQAPMLAGCAVETGIGEAELESWATDEGQRNTEMVRFTGDAWSSCRYPNTRFGCGSLDVTVKLMVKPVAGVDLAWKKVGIAYRSIGGDQSERTAIGYYVSTQGAYEEWHVPVTVYANAATLVFDAWYQDGAGHTYVDDNQGERHVANTSYAYNVVRNEPWMSTVAVDDSGVRGRVSVQVADLDYDKELVLVGTTDDWATSFELGTGAPGQSNRWHWVEDFAWSNYERWQLDIDLPSAGVERFQYAILYRHGIRNDARRYEFWDNNWNNNYTVTRPEPQPPVNPE